MNNAQVVIALLSGTLLSTADPILAADSTVDPCERDWQDLSNEYTLKSPADYAGLLQGWKALESKCGASTLYKARLGLTYYFLDRPKEAREVVGSISAADKRQEPMAEVVELLADIALLQKPTEADLRALEARVRSFSERNPTFIGGLSLLADVLSELDRDGEAIELYEKALAGMRPSPRAAGVLRNLAISYANVSRYPDAYVAAQKALALDKSLLGDLYFVCAVAKSQAAAGEANDAIKTLTLIATKKPEVKSNPEFKSALAFVGERLKASER